MRPEPPRDGAGARAGVASPRPSRLPPLDDAASPEQPGPPPQPEQRHPFGAGGALSRSPSEETPSRQTTTRPVRMTGREKRQAERARMDAAVQNPDVRASPARRLVFDHVTSARWFERAVLLVIVANCVTLAMADPRNDNTTLERLELGFQAFFTVELLLKWAALGLFCEHGYFRDSWNVLDFVIVACGFLTLLPGVNNFTAVRVLRVLRPLRAVNSMPGLRVIVRTLLRSLGKIGDVLVLLLFLFTLWAIVGVQLWAGSLRQRCFGGGGDPSLPPGDFCSTGPRGFHCPAALNETCLAEGPPPEEGLVGFDNFGVAMLSLYQTMTLSDWPGLMEATMDTTSGFSWIYYVSFILTVAYFAVNLVLAVISDEFAGLSGEAREDERERLEEELRLEAEREAIPLVRLPSDLPLVAGGGGDDAKAVLPGAADGGDAHAFRRIDSRASNGSVLETAAASETRAEEEAVLAAGAGVPPPELGAGELGDIVQRPLLEARALHVRHEAYLARKPGFFRGVFRLVESRRFEQAIAAVILLNTACLAAEHHGQSDAMEQALYAANVGFTAIFVGEMLAKLLAYGAYGYCADPFNLFDGVVVLLSVAELLFLSGGGALSVFRALRLLRVLRLARSWRALRVLLLAVAGSLGSIGYMTCLLGLHLGLFSVLGMQLFSGKWENGGAEAAAERTRARYDGFGASLLAVFQQVTGDAWNQLMTSAATATSSGAAVTFSVLVTGTGMFVVLSLFVAIVLEGLAAQDEAVLEQDALGASAARLAAAEPYEHEHAVRELAAELARRRLEAHAAEVHRAQQAAERRLPPRMRGVSLGLFSARSPVRRACWRLVQHPATEAVVTVAILVNCAILAADNPGVDEDSRTGRAIRAADLFFAAFFAVEMALKVVALGWKPYMADPFNRLDAFVVLASGVALLFPSVAVARALRGLRPLRVVVRNRQVRVVLESLYRATPAISVVAGFLGLFFVVLGVLGVSLFGGRLRSCAGRPELDEVECAAAGLAWENASAHFDNLAAASLSLFQVATLSAWADIMYAAIDSAGEGVAPRRNATPAASLYFIVAVVVLSLAGFSLFTGAVVDNFARLKAVYEGSAFLTDEQRRWVATHKLIRSVRRADFVKTTPPPGRSGVRAFCFSLVMHRWFDRAVLGAIFVNVALMASQHHGQSRAYADFLDAANLVFLVAFTLEAVLKVLGLGWRQYWISGWNRFDLFVVVASIAGEAMGAGVGASAVRVLRSFRAIRAVKRLESLQRMFETLLHALPALFNIALLVFVNFFMFAVLGVELFGEVAGFRRHTGFANFGDSCLTLFVMSTSEGWEEYMNVARDATSDAAAVYFVAFMLLVTLVLLELLVAVVLDQFADAGDSVQMALLKERVQLWASSWRDHADASGSLRASRFEDMMSAAPYPFGLGHRQPRRRVLARLRQWRIPLRRATRREMREAGGGEPVWVVDFHTTLERIAETQFVPERQRGFEENFELLKSDNDGAAAGTAVRRTTSKMGTVIREAGGCLGRLLRRAGFMRETDDLSGRADNDAITIDKWYAVAWIEEQYSKRRNTVREAARRARERSVMLKSAPVASAE